MNWIVSYKINALYFNEDLEAYCSAHRTGVEEKACSNCDNKDVRVE